MNTRAVALGLVALATMSPGCKRGGACDHVREEITSERLVGSKVLKFRGRVPRNLLFISMDTFRRDHHGAYGDMGLTPFMKRIAREGVVMEDHLQCSNWTWASTTCTLAGRTNVEAGFVPNLIGPKDERVPIPEGTPFLASYLADAGFVSAVITNNSWMSKEWGNTQGYTAEELPKTTGPLPSGIDVMTQVLEEHPAADRWFLHAHFMEPHAAYDPPEKNVVGRDALPEWPYGDLTKRKQHYAARDRRASLEADQKDLLEQHLRLLYAGEIRTLDQLLEASWSKLERGCWLEDTLVVFWNDHGEQFWEHGNQTHAYDLKRTENDGILVFWANNIVPGRYDGLTSTTDLVATLLDLYDLPIPPEVTGIPIGEAPPDRPVFGEAIARRGVVQSVTRDDVKLHFTWSSGKVEMFDRTVDPEELDDLYDPEDPLVQELWGLLGPQVLAMHATPQGGRYGISWPRDLPQSD